MTTTPPPAGNTETEPRPTPAEVPMRRRDSARTRQRLLDAARRRFAQNGYSGTPVRDIAEDAGVNVSLINRYFESKEGLFAACLTAAVDDLRRTTADSPFDTVSDTIASQVAGTDEDNYEHLLLLVRSSGDERADQIRVDVLRSYSESLAARAGWRPEDPAGGDILLRAQLVLSTAIGVVLLRSSGLHPLASADEQNLAIPLRELVNTMLRR